MVTFPHVLLALSQAPPALAIKIARAKPLVMVPKSRPAIPGTPNTTPTTTGINSANKEGVIISRCAPLVRSEEHTSELQSRPHLVCRLLLEKKKKKLNTSITLYNNDAAI